VEECHNTTDIFLVNGAEPPPWNGRGGGILTKMLSQEPLQEALRRTGTRTGRATVRPERRQGRRSSVNRAAFEFIRSHELYDQNGQIRAATQMTLSQFPVEAREIKAPWRRLSPQLDPARLHTAQIVRNGNTETWA
jgi:hypothetical protein